jgi:hypothetical protein
LYLYTSGHDGVFLIPHADFMQRVAARPNTEAGLLNKLRI